MPVLSPESLSLVDIALLLIILVGMPLESILSREKTRRHIQSGADGARQKLYRQTIFLLWGITLPILLIWMLGERNWAALGFRFESGWQSWAGWAIAALPAGFFLWQYIAVRAVPSFRAQFQAALTDRADTFYFMPETKAEHSLFRLTGITAGITEEIIFRGYLLWALGMFVPLWGAALISLGVFVALHHYQGARNLPMVFVLGAIMTAIVLVSGSLWPAIALHIFVDVIINDTVWRACGYRCGRLGF